ncbi:peroxisome proliferator-activated receptor gamma coactivator 1-alpha isoform X2 [Oryzias melastigma]|uniref:Peroxisome proliferator-activated receptor gamma, coactivator 1 beta n=1 Tax=Oryzias melastigma TaxID=30732 RepID=A0A3B3DWS4_ORYME|nr:peroxisome proliferator-activated receptor gamma coactivator 1-alpha isoform X2 [Oryzias melastigma]
MCFTGGPEAPRGGARAQQKDLSPKISPDSGVQVYGEEEVCSDRLDTDFSDIDLSQLDTSDFDSVNCLSELQWCNDQPADMSPASIRYSTADELFEIEEEHAALLAALTDSLDGMVDAEVGGLSVFPALEEEPSQEEEDEDSLPLSAEDISQSLGAETEDPSLLKKLLLTPPNAPTGIDVHKDGAHSHRYGNRSLRLRPVRPLTKSDLPQDRKPRAVRPAGRLCIELHRHLTTAQDTEDSQAADTEEDEEEDEDSESEEEEEEESSSSEVEATAAAAPAEPAKPQFSSEKELHSVVELITYMHTYCLPVRKQQGWERKDLARPRAKPEAARPASTNSHSRAAACPGTSGGSPRRLPFARQREVKASSLLRELLQLNCSFDVSQPYRLHSPPYAHHHSPSRGASPPKSQLCKLSSSPERRNSAPPQSLEEPAETSGSFSVRRSRRLASFPSRFAKRLRPGRPRDEEWKDKEEKEEQQPGDKLLPTQAGAGTTTELQQEQRRFGDGGAAPETTRACCHEKRSCLCLPLNSKSSGESHYSSKSFEQTLSVDLCGTAGLTPPTTPPHKPVEDELFKPTDGGKSGSSGDGGGDSVYTPSNPHTSGGARGWPSRPHHQRKLPEQTELYAQLRRMGQAGGGDSQRSLCDHDYCALSLGESHRRNAAILDAMLHTREESEGDRDHAEKEAEDQGVEEKGKNGEEEGRMETTEVVEEQTMTTSPQTDCQAADATPPASEEEAECSSASRSPSPVLHMCPDSPSSKTDSSENSEMCPEEKLRSKAESDEDNCQVFYIHNLPSSVTQNMLRKRFQVFGSTEDCKVIICNEERCGVIKIRQSAVQRHRKERETVFQSSPTGLRRLTRKRYIDLDEAGPGPVKSKYDALDFDTLLKEAQKSLHR